MLLTIVTVTKDDVSGIESTLESVSRLRKDPFFQAPSTNTLQHLVVDSSAPGHAQQVKALAEKHACQYHWQEPEGISHAFNTGLAKAQGQWVWFLNGGDTLVPDLDACWFGKTLTYCEADVLIFTIRDRKKSSTKALAHPYLSRIWPLYYNWINHPATLVRTSTLRNIGGFSEKLQVAMDFDLWIRLLTEKARFNLLTTPIADFSPGGVSENLALRKKENFLILKKYGIYFLLTQLTQVRSGIKAFWENWKG